MDELNYRHLLYFWVVTQEGSVTRASQKLSVAQPTISAQLKTFERTLRAPLFRRTGRTLELTETGRTVQRYAEQIFSLGRDLLAQLEGRETAHPVRWSVGVARDVPAALAETLLSAALPLPQLGTVSILTGTAAELIAALAAQRVDLVLGAEAGHAHTAIRTHSRVLVESPVVFAGPTELATRYRRGFPGSLQNAPLVLPPAANELRLNIDRWLLEHRVQPKIVAEVDDEAWQRRLCRAGRGLIAIPAPRPGDGLHSVGKLAGVTLSCYGITLDRQPSHPGVRAVLETAGGHLRVRPRE
jgi:LysR family transcriptional activator of nhaA